MCKCKGVMKIVWGALLLLNAFLWPKWLGVDGWVAWIAVLMIVVGAVKLLVPPCQCCDHGHCEMPMKKRK